MKKLTNINQYQDFSSSNIEHPACYNQALLGSNLPIERQLRKILTDAKNAKALKTRFLQIFEKKIIHV